MINSLDLGVSPKAGAEPEEEEETVALSEAGQEGEEQVDGENVDQTLPPAHLITQTPPHQRPHHHGHVHQQTCRNTNTPSSAVRAGHHPVLCSPPGGALPPGGSMTEQHSGHGNDPSCSWGGGGAGAAHACAQGLRIEVTVS